MYINFSSPTESLQCDFVFDPNVKWTSGGNVFRASQSNFNGNLVFPERYLSLSGDELIGSSLQLSSCYNFNPASQINMPITHNYEGVFISCMNFNAPIHFANNYDLVSNSLNFWRTFSYCYNFNQPVTFPNYPTNSYAYTFANCFNLNQPITFGKMPESQISECSFINTFAGCRNFNQPVTFPDYASGQTAVAQSVYYNTFYGCSNFNQPVSLGNNAISTYGMFMVCYNFNQPITIPANVVNCASMFHSCYNFNQPITIPANVVNCRNMFAEAKNFSQSVNVVSNNLVDCSYMFYNTNISIENISINISPELTYASYMFGGSHWDSSRNMWLHTWFNNLNMDFSNTNICDVSHLFADITVPMGTDVQYKNTNITLKFPSHDINVQTQLLNAGSGGASGKPVFYVNMSFPGNVRHYVSYSNRTATMLLFNGPVFGDIHIKSYTRSNESTLLSASREYIEYPDFPAHNSFNVFNGYGTLIAQRLNIYTDTSANDMFRLYNNGEILPVPPSEQFICQESDYNYYRNICPDVLWGFYSDNHLRKWQISRNRISYLTYEYAFTLLSDIQLLPYSI